MTRKVVDEEKRRLFERRKAKDIQCACDSQDKRPLLQVHRPTQSFLPPFSLPFFSASEVLPTKRPQRASNRSTSCDQQSKDGSCTLQVDIRCRDQV